MHTPWDKRDGGFGPSLWGRSTFWDKIPRPFCPSYLFSMWATLPMVMEMVPSAPVAKSR